MLRNYRGDTSITLLIAAVLVAGAALGGNAIVKFLRKQSQFSHATGTALMLETHVLNALQQPQTYNETSAAALKAGAVPLDFVIFLEKGKGLIPVASVVRSIQLTELGEPCNGPTCALKSDLAIRCDSGLCRAAYRIEFNAESLKISVPPLGASQWPPAADDFTHVIVDDLYRRSGAKTKCLDNELFVGGMKKAQGSVECVRPAVNRLEPNEIGKSVFYSAATNSLELKGANLHRGKCPTRYVAQQINVAKLDTAAEGNCTYRYKKEVPWMKPWPGGQESVSNRFCPSQDYEAVGDGQCSMNVISQTNGICPSTCTDAAGHSYDCTYEVPPNISYTIQQSVSGPSATCTLTKTGSQQCGAHWQGEVRWSGKCKITVPETKPMEDAE